MKNAARWIASFDSASAMLRATSAFLRGEDFPGIGIASSALLPVGLLVNGMPKALREQVYSWSGWWEALRPRRLGRVRTDGIAEWVVSSYPHRPYPAVAIGSSNGALVHLCAALGIPWLPQTFLIPVRRHVGPDDVPADFAFGAREGHRLLDANPDLQLHHMHDANQDRLMIRHMTYFRVKMRGVPPAYRRFLERCLAPGGRLLVIDCRLRWPSVHVADRHHFQLGAYGGMEPEEYVHATPRVREWLGRHGIEPPAWQMPDPEEDPSEAEWGFEPAMLVDLRRFARDRGASLASLAFERPEDLSPLVAELYRLWYERHALPTNRLLVESFILQEPTWAIRTGSIPFWTSFPTEPAAKALQSYLDEAPRFADVFAMLFSHGVDSVGLVPADAWRSLMRTAASRRSGLIGVDERRFPRDFASFIRYHTDLRRVVKARYPIPPPLSLTEFEQFARERGSRFGVSWTDETLPPLEERRIPHISQDPTTTAEVH